jgi:ZIP family zinc transporter
MDDTAMISAAGLTLLAGLATGVGGLAAVFAKRTNTGFLAASLGFSAGVMIYVSFVELFPSGTTLLQVAHGPTVGKWLTVAAFLGGIACIALIDFVVPEADNPHDAPLSQEDHIQRNSQGLRRAGALTALAIFIHNFPEGMATFVSAIHDMKVGIPIAVAVALHNIPEGVSVAIPVYYSTGSKKKALCYSFLAGLAEPVGAFLGYALVGSHLSGGGLGIIHSAVAGVMVFVSLDQLIPNAKKYESGHTAVYGLISGIAVMAVTLLIL